jgi:hypothetical protein
MRGERLEVMTDHFDNSVVAFKSPNVLPAISHQARHRERLIDL